MTTKPTFACASCGGTFDLIPGDDAVADAEAAEVFPPEEIAEGLEVVCHDCWLAMRAAMPEFDQLYRNH